jgi:hypothetical protein
MFQDSNFPKSYLPPIRGSSWHKNEIKMIWVWRDPWISRPHSYRVISLQGDCHIRRVSDILNEHDAWNFDLLRRHFMQADIQAITKIKPSLCGLDNEQAWAPTMNGISTVKSVLVGY